MKIKAKGRIGTSLELFLKGNGIFEETDVHAAKAVLVWQIQQAMKAKEISKKALSNRMRTSRTQVDRLLDPRNDRVSLEIIYRAAFAVGKRVNISLEDENSRSGREQLIPAEKVLPELAVDSRRSATMLRGARHKAQVTQKELATFLRLPLAHISEMERGRRQIDRRLAVTLGRKLKCDFRVFL